MSRTVYFGKVTDNADADDLLRVKVKLTGFADEIETDWLRVIQPTASASHGHMFLPDVDDEVVVLRGADDDFASMVVLGTLYNGSNTPDAPDVGDKGLNKSQILSRAGHRLIFDDTGDAGNITIETAGGHKIFVDDDGGTIDIESTDAINIKGPGNITVESDNGDISVKAGTGKVDIEASVGDVSVKGMNVKIEATANAEIKGTAGIKLDGTGPVEVSSAAILTLKGSLIKIG